MGKNIYSATLKREQSIQVHYPLLLLKSHIQLWFPELHPACLVARGSLSLFLPSSQVAAPPVSTQRHCWSPDVTATTTELPTRKEESPAVLSGYQYPGNSSFSMRMLSLVSYNPLSKHDWQERISPRTAGEKQHRSQPRPGRQRRSLRSCWGGEARRHRPQTRHEARFTHSPHSQHSPAPTAGTGSHGHGHRQDPGVSHYCWDQPTLPGKTTQQGSLPQGMQRRSASSGHGSRSGYLHTGQARHAQEFT